MCETLADNFSWSIIDIALLFFASSTFAYEIVLIARIPIWTWYPFLFIALGVFLVLQHFYGEHLWNFKISDPSTFLLIIVAAACSLINLFTLRPDADDFSFFHRAVFSLQDLQAPVHLYHTAHDIKSLPAISPIRLIPSIEIVTALIAKSLGIHPVLFYHNIIGTITLFIFPLIYFSIFRFYKFSYYFSLTGIILIIILFLYSGDSHQDYGNFTLVRAWQGKCILTALIVPLSSVLTFRYIYSGRSSDFLRLHLSAISALGLSGTAFFLFPFIITFSSITAIACKKNNNFPLKRIFSLAYLSIPFSILIVIIKSGIIPEITNTDAWNLPLNSEALRPELIMLKRTIFTTKTTLFLYLFSVFCGLFLYRDNRNISCLFITSICISIALVTPPVSSLLIKITLPQAYWRLAYASQMLLIITIFTLNCFDEIRKNSGIKPTMKFSLGMLVISIFLLLKNPILTTETVSLPQKFKFSPSEIIFFKNIEKDLQNNTTIASPENLVPILGLLREDIRFISTRRLETSHVFINANMKYEGLLRINAQQDLTNCGKMGFLNEAIRKIPSLTSIIFPSKCIPEEIATYLNIDLSEWNINSYAQYQLWQRK